MSHTPDRNPVLPPALLAVAAAMAILQLQPIYSLDVWWHLSMGRAVLAHGSRTVPEPTAWLGPDSYVDPEWLFDVMLVGVEAVGGPVALALLVSIFAAASTIATFAAARVWGASQHAAVGLTALLMLICQFRFIARPQLAFFLFVPLALLLGRLARDRGGVDRWAALGALHALLAVWSQTHSSIAVAPAIALFALAPFPVRAQRWPIPEIVAALALVVWPLTGAHGLHIIDQVLRHSDADATAYISDMRPPDWADILVPFLAPTWLFVQVLVAATLAVAIGRRRGSPGAWLLMLLGLALASTAVRFRAAWALLTAPLASEALEDLDPGPLASLTAAATMGGLALMMVGQMGFGLDEDFVAVELADAIAEHGVTGRILNEYDAGGYLGWRFAPDLRVSIDGRTPTHFDADMFFLYRQMRKQDDVAERLLDKYAPDAVAIRRDAPVCAHLATRLIPVWVGSREALFLPASEASPLPDPCLEPDHGLAMVDVDEASLAQWDAWLTEGRFTPVLAEAGGFVRTHKQEADPRALARLARACQATGDGACAARYAWRAAILGAPADDVLRDLPPSTPPELARRVAEWPELWSEPDPSP